MRRLRQALGVERLKWEKSAARRELRINRRDAWGSPDDLTPKTVTPVNQDTGWAMP
jgi:hypothetical protein